MDTFADWVQIVSTLVTVSAVVAALLIAAGDRRHSAKVAKEDREASARQARLLFEWDAAKRLSILEARGGHTDEAISKDMGAETLALIALLGPDRVPKMWDRRVGKSDEELAAFVDDEKEPQFLRDSVEAERAMTAIATELRKLG